MAQPAHAPTPRPCGQVPSNMTAEEEARCFHGDCEIHRECGPTAFCCFTDLHHGCTPATPEEVRTLFLSI